MLEQCLVQASQSSQIEQTDLHTSAQDSLFVRNYWLLYMGIKAVYLISRWEFYISRVCVLM